MDSETKGEVGGRQTNVPGAGDAERKGNRQEICCLVRDLWQGQAEASTQAVGFAETSAVCLRLIPLGREGLQLSLSAWSTRLPSLALVECDVH